MLPQTEHEGKEKLLKVITAHTILFSKREDSRLQQQSQAGETQTGAGCLKLGSRLVHSELNWQNHKLQ